MHILLLDGLQSDAGACSDPCAFGRREPGMPADYLINTACAQLCFVSSLFDFFCVQMKTASIQISRELHASQASTSVRIKELKVW